MERFVHKVRAALRGFQAWTWHIWGDEGDPQVAGWVLQYRQLGKLALLSLPAYFKKEAKEMPSASGISGFGFLC